MTYNPSTPQSTEDPKVSQGYFLSNFGLLNTNFGVNHIQYTSSQTRGFHTKLYFPTGLTTDPNLVTPSSSLYPKFVGALSQLFYQNGALGTNVSQLTGIPVANRYIQAITKANPGQVTSNNHGLSNGDMVTFTNVQGMLQLNGNTYTITKIDANNFTIGIDTSGGGFGTFILGTGVYTTNNATISTLYGILSPWGLNFNFGTFTFSGGTKTVFYSIPYSNNNNYITLLTPAQNTSGITSVSSSNSTSFTAKTTDPGISCYYISIGN